VRAAFVAVVLAIVAVPAPASAHAALDGSSPVPNAVLPSAPGEISLDFSEAIEERLASIRLFDGDEKEIAIERARRLTNDPSVVVAALPPIAAGVYVVVWRVVSADGHPLKGSYSFEVGDTTVGDTTQLVETVVRGLDYDSSVGVPLGVGRFLAYFGVIALVGAVVLTWGSAGRLLASHRGVKVMSAGLAALTVGTLAVLFLQGPHVTGGDLVDMFDATLIADVAGTRLGISLLARLGLVLVWAVVLLGALRGLADGTSWRLSAMVASVGTILTFPAGGHPSALPAAAAHVALGAVHVGSLSAWIGALGTTYVLRRDDEALVGRLSRVATVAMPVTVLSGLVLAARLTDGFEGVLDTDFGRLLGVKTVLVVLVMLGALAARQRLRTSRDVSASLRFETLAAVAVLAVTAGLTASAPTAIAPPPVWSTSLVADGVLLDVSVSPARVGSAEVHVIAAPPGGALAPVRDATATLAMPSRDLPPSPVNLVLVGPNHYVGIVQIPYAGEWTMSIEATGSKGEALAWSGQFTVDK
jgi:copper transport protein